MKKCLAILLCAMLMVLALASVAVAEEKDGYRFVIVPKCVHPWFDEVNKGAVAELLGGKGKVAVMQGVPTAPNHAERYEAHIAVLSQYPDIEIIDGGIDNDDIQTAQSQAAAVIAANPDLNGYLCCDASGPIGIANALRAAG